MSETLGQINNAFEGVPAYGDVQKLVELGPENVFSETGAIEWIRANRCPQAGELNIEATASHLSLELGRKVMLYAGTLDDSDYPMLPAKVTFNHRVDPQKDRLTLGHETGHMFLNHSLGFPRADPDYDIGLFHSIEDFCEIFGQEMVLPRAVLSSIKEVDTSTIEALQATYGADLNTVIVQLMRAQKLPQRIFLDTKLSENSHTPHRERAVRVTVCYGCQTNFGWGECTDTSEEAPVFDFLHKPYGTEFPVCSSYTGIHWLDESTRNG